MTTAEAASVPIIGAAGQPASQEERGHHRPTLPTSADPNPDAAPITAKPRSPTEVAAGRIPVFQAAVANFNPRTELQAGNESPDRGPTLIISAEHDHQVPWAIANATYKRQHKFEHNVTEIVEIPGRGHSLTIDSGSPQVAQTALDLIQRFVK